MVKGGNNKNMCINLPQIFVFPKFDEKRKLCDPRSRAN